MVSRIKVRVRLVIMCSSAHCLSNSYTHKMSYKMQDKVSGESIFYRRPFFLSSESSMWNFRSLGLSFSGTS